MNISLVKLFSVSQPHQTTSSFIVDVSTYSLISVASLSSIYFYKVSSPNDISFVNSLFIGSPLAIKFHLSKPFIACAESQRVSLIDCENFSSTFLNFPENKKFLLFDWISDYLICLVSQSTLICIDFFVTKKVLWKYELITPFRLMVSDHRSNLLLLSNNFTVWNFSDIKNCVCNRSQHNFEKFDEIVDCFYHNSAENLIIFSTKKEVFGLFTNSKQIFKILEVQNPFSQVVWSLKYHNHFLTRNETSIHFFQEINQTFQYVSKISKLKKNNSILVAFPLFEDTFIEYEPSNSLSLISYQDSLKTFSQSFDVPIFYSCFTHFDHFLVLGTQQGEVIVLDFYTGLLTSKWRVCTTEILSISSDEYLIGFVSKKSVGLIFLKEKYVKFFNKLYNARKILLKSGLIIVQKDQYLICVINQEREVPITFSSSIISITIQSDRTPSTSFGEKINFAVFLSSGEIQIFSKNSVFPVLRLRTSINSASIAWKGDVIVTGDGQNLIFFDFSLNESRFIFINSFIQKVEFDQNGLYLLTHDHKIAFIQNSVCFLHEKVKSFSVIGDGLLLIEGYDQTLRLICASNQSVAGALRSKNERLKSLHKKLKLIDFSLPGSLEKASFCCETEGFLFESLIYSVFSRRFEGKELPISLHLFGKKEEIISKFLFETTAKSADLFTVFKLIKTKDFSTARSLVSKLSGGNFFGIIASAFLESEIKSSAVDFLLTNAILLMKEKRIEEALILFSLANRDSVAAKFLQDLGEWEKSIEILKLNDETEETKILLRKAAHHLYDSQLLNSALFLFTSVGDFHPALHILFQKNLFQVASFILSFLEKQNLLVVYDSPFENDFLELDLLRREIIKNYDKV